MPSPTPAPGGHLTARLLGAIGWFIPERAENRDRVVLLRKQLYVVLCFLVAGNAFFFSVLHLLHHIEGRNGAVIPVMWVLGFTSLALPFFLRRVGSLRLPGTLFVGVFVVGVTAVASLDGGLVSGAMFWLIVAPLVAAFLVGAPTGWATAAVVATIGLTLYGAASAGYEFVTHISPEHAAAHRVLNFVSVALFTAAAAWLYESQTVGHLRALSERLAATNHRLRQELAERERAQARAEAASRAKDTLLANMGHEFRTPLAGIIGCTELLTAEAEGEQAEFLDLIDQSARRLLATLNGVLTLAQLEGGKVEVTSGPVNVRDELLAAVAPLRPLAEARGLSLTTDGPPVLARADAEALRRVVEILVENAIKFTERGGVSVSTASTPEGVLLRVADTGAGIAPGFLPHLFEAFRQESDGNARTHEGSGVGLAIARSLVDRMGGEISAESAPGRGSVFTVRLPRWVPAERAAPPISA